MAENAKLTKMVDALIGDKSKEAASHFHDYVTSKVSGMVNPVSVATKGADAEKAKTNKTK